VGQDYTWEFVLSWDPYIAVTQDDVRQLQLAKGTILCRVARMLATTLQSTDKPWSRTP
jgi:hypothetical protein